MSNNAKRTIGQAMVLLSGLALILVITIVTKEMAVLWGLIFVGGMLVNMSKNSTTALKEGFAVLVVNFVIGIIFFFVSPDPTITWAMLGSWFVMVRVA